MSLDAAPVSVDAMSVASLPVEDRPHQRVELTDLLPPLAIVLWVVALNEVHVKPMGGYGLLPLLPVTYWLAVFLLAVSFAWQLRPGRLSPPRLALHVVLLVTFLHGTVPALFADPRYAWVYRHFGVVNYINAHGRVNDAIDIYHNWPGFFAAAAWLTKVAGAGDPIRYAAWAQVYFNLLNALAFGFVVSVLTSSRRKRWLAVFLFVAANWVGEDYFSPQALAYVLCLVIFGIILRWYSAAGTRWLQTAERVAQRLVRSRVVAEPPLLDRVVPPLRRGLLTGIVFALFAVVVVSHQLSPYVLIIGVGLLTVAGLVRPRWMVFGLAAIAIAYLAPHFTYVNRVYGLLNALGNPFRNSRPRVGLGQGSAGRAFSANAARILSVGLWALAAVGAARRWRRGLPAIGLLLLAGSPALTFLLQDYGGEAIYRAFLFSLPWTVFLAVEALAPDGEHWSIGTLARAGAAAAVLVSLFVPAYFGLEAVNEIRPGEVAAANYFYARAAPTTVLVLAAPNFPARLAADYDQHIARTPPGDPVLLATPRFSDRLLGPQDLLTIDDAVASVEPDQATAGYLVISTSMKAYCDEYGLGPSGALDDLDRLLSGAPRWRTFYRDSDAVIYELLPPASGGT